MKQRYFVYGLIGTLILMGLISGCASNNPAANSTKPVELNVSAALGLKEALFDIQKQYEAIHPDVKIVYNLGAAGNLQTQIEQGAPADIFISAAQQQLDNLQKKNLIKPDSRINLVGNQLVLVVPNDSRLGLTDFKDLAQDSVKKFGLGAPETVPAGQYGVEVLKAVGVWDKVKDKAVLGKDVRTLVAYAETGNVDASIVFSTVAATSSKVKVAAAAPPGTHQAIVFPGAVLAGTKHAQEAEQFLHYLAGPEAMKIFQKYGFIPLTNKQ
ncbi:Hypothetical protein LUCI_4979 [Lucifera butyrica]|uniref:Uncharacterized protein n=1 Tax=Lucifera butyrica TaxID=1351585 RepID=A0A498RDX0_9FIRM|nr:molybdate ABC transporter substrate-binding protein [Lucifera butyrica]VBB09681.1 Hypothetical protein LUCI_4979 [Lucifera butyrica]